MLSLKVIELYKFKKAIKKSLPVLEFVQINVLVFNGSPKSLNRTGGPEKYCLMLFLSRPLRPIFLSQ